MSAALVGLLVVTAISTLTILWHMRINDALQTELQAEKDRFNMYRELIAMAKPEEQGTAKVYRPTSGQIATSKGLAGAYNGPPPGLHQYANIVQHIVGKGPPVK